MKQFFEHYGAVVLGALALIVVIVMITPVGNIIKTSLHGVSEKFHHSVNSQTDVAMSAAHGAQNSAMDHYHEGTPGEPSETPVVPSDPDTPVTPNPEHPVAPEPPEDITFDSLCTFSEVTTVYHRYCKYDSANKTNYKENPSCVGEVTSKWDEEPSEERPCKCQVITKTYQYQEPKCKFGKPVTLEAYFSCFNKDQKPGGAIPMPYCLNYEINFYSYSPANGIMKWSGWLDSGKPSFDKTGGDFEFLNEKTRIPIVMTQDDINNFGEPLSFEMKARAAMYPSVPLYELEQTTYIEYFVVNEDDTRERIMCLKHGPEGQISCDEDSIHTDFTKK